VSDAPATPSMAIVSHMYPQTSRPHLGVFVSEQVRALINTGAPVTRVVSPVPWAPWPLPLLSKRWRTYDDVERRRVDFEHVHVDFPRHMAFPGKRLPNASAASAVRSIRRDTTLRDHLTAAGVLVAHSALLDGTVARGLSRRSGVPYIVFVHGEDLYQHLDPRAPASLRATVTKVLENAAMVVAVSSAVEGGLRDALPELSRLRVLHNGVDIERFHPSELSPRADGVLRTLSAGHLVRRKANDVVLRALAAAADTGVAFEHTIAGEGPERADLEALAAELGIGDRVRFIGAYHHDDLPELMWGSDLFLLPSWDEAFGVVYLEALASGVPVVAASDGGAVDIVDDDVDGFLVPPRDVAAVAAAVGRFAALAAVEREAMRAAARRKSEAFTWEANARGLVGIVREVAGEWGMHASLDRAEHRGL